MSLPIWLTDRSRYTTGLGRCKRERYLKNHAGPTGYGMVHKSESLPLMTGTYFHEAMEILWLDMKERDAIPHRDAVRYAIARANTAYEQKVEKRGFRGMLQSESTDRVIVEQQYLIAGLVWAAWKNLLPWIHTHYRILQAELESIYVLDCTCGLTSAVLDASLHASRGCQGIGQMLKQDCIAEKRIGGGLAYFESKTTGWGGDNWAPQWETKPQLSIGSFGIVERYQKELTELFVVAAYKGSRKTTEPKDPFEEKVTWQESPFCRGYCRSGNPPLATDDWTSAYEWTDDQGRTKRISRDYKKRGVWELQDSDWPTWTERDPSLSPIEVWINQMPDNVINSQVYLIGPLNRQDVQIEKLKTQIVGEERQWQAILWELYELQQAGFGWETERFQRELDRLVPASWECRRFGVKHECEFVPICFEKEGWEDPLGPFGAFRPRRPHHIPELEQAVSRGLLPEQAEDEEEDE